MRIGKHPHAASFGACSSKLWSVSSLPVQIFCPRSEYRDLESVSYIRFLLKALLDVWQSALSNKTAYPKPSLITPLLTPMTPHRTCV